VPIADKLSASFQLKEYDARVMVFMVRTTMNDDLMAGGAGGAAGEGLMFEVTVTREYFL
jgi:hypothetical protein